MLLEGKYIRFLDDLSVGDVGVAGGKGANLGEMRKAGFPVPDGFVVTTEAFELFTRANGLEKKIGWLLAKIDVNNERKLETYTSMIRLIIESSRIPKAIVEEVLAAYGELCKRSGNGKKVSVAVRSSATVEDSRDASFAGQQATYLNVIEKDEIITSIKRCWASCYTPRAICYRLKKGFGIDLFTTAVVVQRQIASQKAGVGFSVHPTTGDRDSVVIESVLGQGEELVSGRVTPDTFTLNKRTGMIRERRIAEKRKMKVPNGHGVGLAEVAVPRRLRQAQSLKGSELIELWSLARKLEAHYNHPQDFEWAVEDGTIYLLQTRPVTVLAKADQDGGGTSAHEAELKGLGASPGVASGKARLILSPGELGRVQSGEILVTKMTTPDYVPAMMKAAGIVTDEGGMTSHAAIVRRELGVPCVVGTGRATKALTQDTLLTVDGTKGLVFRGRVEAEIQEEGGDAEGPSPSSGAAAGQATTMTTGTKVYMNLGVPEKVQDYLKLPFDGIGLMRIEFIIASYVGAHPLFLLESGVSSKFVDRLAEGMATVAGAVKPRPVVVRFSDFKTNEYRELKGGETYEEQESNPMIGWRGVSRYISQDFSDAFRLELRAMRRVRDEMGLKNVWAMLPFVRTPWEVEKCLGMMEEEGLVRDESFKVWLMAEVPSMVFRAEEFARLCDGFSVGSNDLTQLILGIDRDSSRLGKMGYFDERDVAVKKAVKQLIEAAHASGITMSICVQAPSVYPELAEYLVGEGIDSLSVNPDAVTKTKQIVFEAEEKKMKKVIAG